MLLEDGVFKLIRSSSQESVLINFAYFGAFKLGVIILLWLEEDGKKVKEHEQEVKQRWHGSFGRKEEVKKKIQVRVLWGIYKGKNIL